MAKTPRIEKKPSSLRYYQDGPPASVDVSKWRLKVRSVAGREVGISYQDLLAFPQVSTNRRTVCVCNWTIRRTWTGVLLKEVLNHAGVEGIDDRADLFLKQQSIGTPGKGQYDSTIRLRDAIARGAMIIHSVDDEPLSLEQGYPVRLIDFGVYNYKGVKGLEHLIVTDRFEIGHWEKYAGYDIEGTIKTKKYYCIDLAGHRFIDKPGEVVEF